LIQKKGKSKSRASGQKVGPYDNEELNSYRHFGNGDWRFGSAGRDDSFDLGSLPPGTHTIKAWHEKLGTSTQKITVGGNETKAIDFGFKSQPGT